MTSVGDRLYFFSGSADLLPGRGSTSGSLTRPATACWRACGTGAACCRNFWPADFRLGERTYRTVEHAFQAAKIAIVDPALAERFALDSGTELARGDGTAARMHRKLVLLDEAQLRQWDEGKHTVMRDAMHAKFSRHDPLRTVLLGTVPAELWHGVGRGQPATRIRDLETICEVLHR